MQDMPRLNYIAFSPTELGARCHADMPLSPHQCLQLDHARELVSASLRDEFHALRSSIVDFYVGSELADGGGNQSSLGDALSALLRDLLERADYEALPQASIEPIVSKDSLSKVEVSVDLTDFTEVWVFTRQPICRSEVVSSFFGLRKKTVDYVNFKRVVLFARLQADRQLDQLCGASESGDFILKLFRDVPAADLEMIFPNVDIRMRTLDKLIMAIPALISGFVVVTTKLGSALLLITSIIGFWLGLHSEPVALNRTTALILLAGMGALAMYLWRQAGKFKKRRLRYSQALMQHLYFRLLDDNAGVFFRILFEAEQAELKECLLTYHTLLHTGHHGQDSEALNRTIECWLDRQGDTRTEFQSERSLLLLQSLGLVMNDGQLWQVREVKAV